MTDYNLKDEVNPPLNCFFSWVFITAAENKLEQMHREQEAQVLDRQQGEAWRQEQ